MQHQLLKPHFALHLANNKAYLKLLNHVRRRLVFGWHAFAGENFECCWTKQTIKMDSKEFYAWWNTFLFCFYTMERDAEEKQIHS